MVENVLRIVLHCIVLSPEESDFDKVYDPKPEYLFTASTAVQYKGQLQVLDAELAPV